MFWMKLPDGVHKPAAVSMVQMWQGSLEIGAIFRPVLLGLEQKLDLRNQGWNAER